MLAASVINLPTRRRGRDSQARTAAIAIALAFGLGAAIATAPARADDRAPEPLEPQKSAANENDSAKLKPIAEASGSTLHPAAPTVAAASKRARSKPAIVNGPAPAENGAAETIAVASDGETTSAGYSAPQNAPVTLSPATLSPAADKPAPPHVDKPSHAPKASAKPAGDTDSASVMFKGISDLPPLPALTIDPATFKGIQPGTTMSEELTSAWGPGEKGRNADQRVYKFDTYPRVVVTIADHRVAAISVQLDKPMEADALAKMLHSEKIERVAVFDDDGKPLGEALPERGMLLRSNGASGRITHLLLEAIDAEPFVSRAAADADVKIRRSLQDLDYAIQLDPKNAQAFYLRAELLSRVGRYEDAERSSQAALEISPDNPAYLLSAAAIVSRMERQSEAKPLVNRVLDDNKLPPVVRAQAYCQLGDLLACGPSADYNAAIQAHTKSIKLAQPLLNDKQPDVRRQAKRTSIDAHLGAASDVAYGAWRQKEIVANQWITRADELSRDLVEHEDANPELRLYVARRALDVRAAIGGRWDQSDWAANILQDARRRVAGADDPLHQQQLQWELAQALFDVAVMSPSSLYSDRSLAECEETRTMLESGARHRQKTAEDTYLLGRLYAHVGTIYAIYKLDHAAAVTWFDKARPLLDRPLPAAAAGDLGRHAETFVAMGVSYWQSGRHDEGLRLTQHGVDLLKEAADAKLIDSSELAIPYGNLASMHRELGHADEAANYSELSSRVDTSKRR